MLTIQLGHSQRRYLTDRTGFSKNKLFIPTAQPEACFNKTLNNSQSLKCYMTDDKVGLP